MKKNLIASSVHLKSYLRKSIGVLSAIFTERAKVEVLVLQKPGT